MPADAFLYTKPCNQQLQRLQMALNGAELFRFFRVLCPVFFFFLFVVRSWWPPPSPPPPMDRRQPFVVFHTQHIEASSTTRWDLDELGWLNSRATVCTACRYRQHAQYNDAAAVFFLSLCLPAHQNAHLINCPISRCPRTAEYSTSPFTLQRTDSRPFFIRFQEFRVFVFFPFLSFLSVNHFRMQSSPSVTVRTTN